MDKSHVVTLVKEVYTKDALQQEIAAEVTRDVFCNVESVTRAEWMAAGQSGFNPQYKLTLFFYDYDGESLVDIERNGTVKRYSVYRTYVGKDDDIELYVEQKAGTTHG